MKWLFITSLVLAHNVYGNDFRILLENPPLFSVPGHCEDEIDEPRWNVYKLAQECSGDICKRYTGFNEEIESKPRSISRSLEYLTLLHGTDDRIYDKSDKCGFEKVACSQSFLSLNFSDPYPNAYSTMDDGRILLDILHDQPSLYRYHFGFIKKALSPIQNPITQSIYMNSDKNNIVFVPIELPFREATGIAACLIGKDKKEIPHNCLVIEYNVKGIQYVLGIVEKDLGMWACQAMATFSYHTPYEFSTKSHKATFKNKLIQKLTSSGLSFRKSDITVLDGAEGFQFSASSTERLSVVDNKLREILDIRINFNRESDSELQFTMSLRMSGWISRQASDSPGNWRMPGKGFYSTLEARLLDAVNESRN